MITWGLKKDAWDITTDDVGNIAILSGNERLAQDVASSVRVFTGELNFDITRGVDYNKPDTNQDYLNDQMNKQARLIEGVQSSIVIFEEMKDRNLKPVIYITNEENEEIIVGG